MRRLAIIAAATVVAVSACTSPPEDEGRDSVRAVVSPYLNMMPFHIAGEEGFFEAQGLDVEFIRLGRTQDIMAALASGDVDAAGGMLTVTELNLALQGAEVRLVADLGYLTSEPCDFNAVVVQRKHVESGAIEDPEQIRRMVLDTDLLLPFGYWMDELLRPHGLTVDDLETINLPSPAAIEAFANGLIDITLESEPYLTMYRDMDEAVIWSPGWALAPDYPVAVMMYGPTLLQERREVGERFAVGMLQAMRQYAEGKTPRNLEIVAAASGLPEDLLTRACWPTYHHDGRIRPEAFRAYQEWNVETGLVERYVTDEELYDHRFIERANAELER
jgi:NitT/TauT family transport system substrate-binding protein